MVVYAVDKSDSYGYPCKGITDVKNVDDHLFGYELGILGVHEATKLARRDCLISIHFRLSHDDLIDYSEKTDLIIDNKTWDVQFTVTGIKVCYDHMVRRIIRGFLNKRKGTFRYKIVKEEKIPIESD